MRVPRPALLVAALTFSAGLFVPSAQAEQNTQSGQSIPSGEQRQGSSAAQRMTPANFVDYASALNTNEITAANLALENGAATTPVKNFARQMKEDHAQANNTLAQIAQSKNIDAPPTPEMGSKQSSTQMQQLKAKQGAAFNAAYAHQQVAAHQQTIAYFQRAASSLQDKELKQFASDTLPTLKKHLQLAKELQQETAQQQ